MAGGMANGATEDEASIRFGVQVQTIKLWLGPQELTAELAMTIPQIMTGMMFRKEMAETEGMLFVFGRAHQASFYMRNTLIPLSCGYIDPEGAILEGEAACPRVPELIHSMDEAYAFTGRR
jgi:uncharacterized membrane protein (UPF0127 family)